MKETKTLEALRAPFPASQISKLPKPTKAQTDALKANFKTGIRCHLCGGWHHKDVVHLDYVGHAATTNRLLDVDPAWYWEPLAFDEQGLPKLDQNGGLWIRLTILGVTRLGYGDAQGKTGGDAMKERIGDALRNAAMRFGVALDLWSKADLHAEDSIPVEAEQPKEVEYCTDEKFQENKAKWKKIIESGKTPNDLIKRLAEKTRFNAVQIEEIFAWANDKDLEEQK